MRDIGRTRSRLFGVDTRKRDATASAAVLEALTPFFEDGVFQAPVIDRAIPSPRDVPPTSCFGLGFNGHNPVREVNSFGQLLIQSQRFSSIRFITLGFSGGGMIVL
jgi:hypothetical protein